MPPRGRPFQPGQSGNPRGRPRNGDSLAEAIRQRFSPEKRRTAIDKIVELITSPHGDPHARIKAFDAIAKRGWPEEARGELFLNLPEGGLPVRIEHVHLSSGTSA